MVVTEENLSTLTETCLSDTLSITDPVCNVLGTNPVLRGERPPTNLLSHLWSCNVTSESFSLFFNSLSNEYLRQDNVTY